MKTQIAVNNKTHTGEVRDQGNLPTCLSYAASTAHRADQGYTRKLSAETLHYYANNCVLDSGICFDDIQDALPTDGQPPEEECDPVSRDNHNDWSPPSDVKHYKSGTQVETPASWEVKKVISQGGCPVLGITFPEQFYNPNKPWLISSGEPIGRHAVVGVGITECQEHSATNVMIQNSWGSEWGHNGYAYLTNDFLQNHLEEVLVINSGENND